MIDIGFKNSEVQYNNATSFYDVGYISDMGDLSPFHGYEELDAMGYTIELGKLYPKKLRNWKQLKKLNLTKLQQKGYTTFWLKKYNNQNRKEKLPVQIITNPSQFRNNLNLNQNPSFFLKKNNIKKILIINGKIVDK